MLLDYNPGPWWSMDPFQRLQSIPHSNSACEAEESSQPAFIHLRKKSTYRETGESELPLWRGNFARLGLMCTFNTDFLKMVGEGVQLPSPRLSQVTNFLAVPLATKNILLRCPTWQYRCPCQNSWFPGHQHGAFPQDVGFRGCPIALGGVLWNAQVGLLPGISGIFNKIVVIRMKI